MSKRRYAIYLGGGLFNAGERLHNLYLEEHLKRLGREVILPQREALRFFADGKFNLDEVVTNCRQQCSSKKKIYVGNVDGTDADSGSAIEYGIAITATGYAIIYRTDFRTATEKEVGVNAMFRAKETTFIYEPCFFTELDQVDKYYTELARKIDAAISKLEEK